MALTLAKIKRAGAWLTAVCAIAYTAFSLLDIALHIHEGWAEGARQRDMLHDARADCAAHRFASYALQRQCAQINSTPLPSPWRVAMHHIGHHLRDKITSALRSLVMLLVVLVPTAGAVAYCAYHHHPPHHRMAPAHQQFYDALDPYLSAARHVLVDTEPPPRRQTVIDVGGPPPAHTIDLAGSNKRPPKKFQYSRVLL